MRVALALVVGALAWSCSQKPAEVAPVVAQSPDSNEVEGHGGIAIVEPEEAPLVVPDVKPIRPAVGVVDEAQFRLKPGCPTGAALKDLYLRGYQMKDLQPADALKAFQQVVDCSPPGDEYGAKAADRVKQLRHP